jgi:hypothetical protein
MAEAPKNSDVESLWSKVFEHLLPGIGIIIVLATLNLLISSHETQTKVLLYGMYAVAGAVIVYFKKKLKETVTHLDDTRTEIERQNALANDEFVRIATTDIEEKIFRKLVSTNAIIPDRSRKVSITARVLDDFHDRDEYHDATIVKENTESIDLVRVLSYQNLLLTPKYLEYFYYRRDAVQRATRIIVLDKEQVNTHVCQATLTYLFMSARYGYETYILPEKRFRLLTQPRSFTKENLKIIKGNPFMLKISGNGTDDTYKGYYTDYRENIEDNGSRKEINGIEAWQLLERFKKNSIQITAQSSGFVDHIQTRIATLNQRAII